MKLVIDIGVRRFIATLGDRTPSAFWPVNERDVTGPLPDRCAHLV